MLAKVVALLAALSLIRAAPFEGRNVPASSVNALQPRASASSSTSKSDKPVVAAYYTEWSAYDRKYFLDDVNYDKITHLLYAFMWVLEDGSVVSGDHDVSYYGDNNVPDELDVKAYGPKVEAFYDPLYPQPDFYRPSAPSGKGNEEAKGLKWFKENTKTVGDTKVLLSVGGYNWSRNFSGVAADSSKRKKFVDTTKTLLDHYELDGVDVDWEYPNYANDFGDEANPADTENYVKLIQELRDALPDRLITAALPVAAEKQKAGLTKPLAGLFDYVFLMAYDVMGPWESKYASGSPLLGDSPFAGKTSLAQLEAYGFDKSQIVLGLPGYGKITKTKGSNAIGADVYDQAVIRGTWEVVGEEQDWSSSLDYWHINELKKQENGGWQHCFDEETVASTLWNEKESLLITYDCKHAVQAKKKFVDEQGYAGLMVWAADMDRTGEFINFMAGQTDPNPVHSCGASSGGSASASAGGAGVSSGAEMPSATANPSAGASITTGPLAPIASPDGAAIPSGGLTGATDNSSLDVAGKEATDDTSEDSGLDVAGEEAPTDTEPMSAADSTDTPAAGSEEAIPSGTVTSETPDPAAGASSSESCEGGTYRCNAGKIEQCASTWMSTGWACGESCTGDALFTCQDGVLAQCAGGQAIPSSGAKCSA